MRISDWSSDVCSSDLIAAYFGILRLGAVVVNLSPLYSVEELQQQIIDSSPRAMVTLDARALLPNALAAIGGTSVEHLIVGSIAGALPPAKSMLYRLFSRHDIRSEERRDGKECVSTCRSRWSPYH